MISYERYLATLATSDAAVQQAAQAAFLKLLEKVRAGQTPRSAINAILREFNADAIQGFREALNTILESSLGPKEVAAYKVGRVKLSDALYANARNVATLSQQVIEKHMQGVHDARELREALYDGYDFKADPLDIIVKPLPKYLQEEFNRFKAAQLKTPALRAAYLEAIKAAEAGAGMAELEQKLRIAFYERNRYLANRIARTELHRNYMNRVAQEIMEDDRIEYVQYRLSMKHPRWDICDFFAKADQYGLGPGIYPKAEAPLPPIHPHCLPDDALITASDRITAVSKRWYDGDMAVITTASGQKLAATVNHPVLTPGGWIAIGELQIGQYVICRIGGERPSAGNVQHQHMPTRIAEIADTFFGSRQVTTREVPLSAPDFHGDGMAGQIAVIGADSKLWDRVDAASHQGIVDDAFMLTHEAHALLGDSSLNLRLEAFGPSANGGMGSFRPFQFKFWRRLICLELLRLAHGAQQDPIPLQITSNRQSAYINRFGNRQNGFSTLIIDDQLLAKSLIDFAEFQSGQLARLPAWPQTDPGINQSGAQGFARDANLPGDFINGAIGSIFTDAVVNVDVFRFSGQVYNLETEQGHYASNNIITHNCQCLCVPKIDIFDAKPRFNPKAERAFLRSLPPEEARAIAGSRERLRRILEDGAALKGIYNEGKDPLYQWKRLEDLIETN